MKIGMAGPIIPHALKNYLDEDSAARTLCVKSMGATAVTHLVETLLRRGHTLVIFALAREVEKELILTGPRLKICIGPYREKHRARDFFRVERNYLRRAMLRERPPFIHAHWTYEYALAALDTSLPTIITARDAPFTILRMNPSPYRLIRTLMAIQVARRATVIVANSPHTAAYWRRRMFFRGHLSVIPNSFPPFLLDRVGKEQTILQRGPFLTYGMMLSNWGRCKNGSVGIKAFSLVRKKHPTVRLKMFGEGYGLGEVAHQWALRRGLHEGIDFVGQLDHETLLRRVAREIDILVHPALEESFGNTLVEGMGLGIPVIAGRNSGAMPWVLDGGRAGLLTDVRSPQLLAEDMLRLAEDVDYRRSLAQAGRRRAWKAFSPESVAIRYESLYQELLSLPCKGKNTPL